MHELKIGQVVWSLKRPKGKEWAAFPSCIEKITENAFFFADGCGGSKNSIGKNYFLTREECLKHIPTEEKPAVTSMPKGSPGMMDVVSDGTVCLYLNTTVFFGLLEKRVPEGMLKWRDDEEFYSGSVLTLGEIRDQLNEKGVAMMTVVSTSPLHGEIFMTGNYPSENVWRKFGETVGFA